MKNELVTVITAVYNAEEYLEKCINSVLNQTYKNIEYILVDDGSTDGSRKICEEYAKKDSRVRYIYKENGGASSAQNKGIEEAKGNYISLVDNDDVIHEKTIEILYNELIKNDCDICFAEVKDVHSLDENPLDSEITYTDNDITFYTKEEMLMNCTKTNFIRSYPKVFKKELFNHVKFQEGMFYDDVQLVPHLYDLVTKVEGINIVLYYRLINMNSMIHAKFKPIKYQLIDASMDRLEFFKSKGYDYLLPKTYEYLISNCVFLFKLAYTGDASKEDIKKTINIFRTNYKKYKKYLSFSSKVKYFIFYCFPKLSLKIFMHFNKQYM